MATNNNTSKITEIKETAKEKAAEAVEKAKHLAKEEEPIEIPQKQDDNMSELEELVNEPVAEHRDETPEETVSKEAAPAKVSETAPATPEAATQDVDPFALQAAIMQGMQAIAAKHTTHQAAATINDNLMAGFTGTFTGQKYIFDQIAASELNAEKRHKELSKKIDAVGGVLPTAAYIVAIIVMVVAVFACNLWLPANIGLRKLVSVLLGIMGGILVLGIWPNKEVS